MFTTEPTAKRVSRFEEQNIVEVYFRLAKDAMYYLHIREEPAMTTEDLVASIGGDFGHIPWSISLHRGQCYAMCGWICSSMDQDDSSQLRIVKQANLC